MVGRELRQTLKLGRAAAVESQSANGAAGGVTLAQAVERNDLDPLAGVDAGHTAATFEPASSESPC